MGLHFFKLLHCVLVKNWSFMVAIYLTVNHLVENIDLNGYSYAASYMYGFGTQSQDQNFHVYLSLYLCFCM